MSRHLLAAGALPCALTPVVLYDARRDAADERREAVIGRQCVYSSWRCIRWPLLCYNCGHPSLVATQTFTLTTRDSIQQCSAVSG